MTTATDQELSVLSIRNGQVEFDQPQQKALTDVLRIRHASQADMRVFFHQCRRTELDPFLRQIYMIARQEYDPETQTRQWRQTFQTGIDGFRAVAHRRATKLRVELSYEDVVYYDAKGEGHEVWLDDENPPVAVKVVVHLGNARFPFVARYSDFAVMKDEYEPDVVDANGKKTKGKKTGRRVPQGMWATRPTGQLEKCAEASALRRACPQDLSGIYEFAELGGGEPRDEPITTLVDDGSGKPKPKPKGGRNWVRELGRAKTPEAARQIWNECEAAGELSTEVKAKAQEVALKFGKAQREDAQQTGQPPVGSETSDAPKPGDEAPEPAAEDAQQTGQSTAVEEPVDEPPADEGDDPWSKPADA